MKIRTDFPPLDISFKNKHLVQRHKIYPIGESSLLQIHNKLSQAYDPSMDQLKLYTWHLNIINEGESITLYQRKGKWQKWMIHMVDLIESRLTIKVEYMSSDCRIDKKSDPIIKSEPSIDFLII